MLDRTQEKRLAQRDAQAQLESEDECTCGKVEGVCRSSLHPRPLVTFAEARSGHLHTREMRS